MPFSVEKAEDFLKKAEESGVNGNVIDYIKENPEKYFNHDLKLYPIGWRYVSEMLNHHTPEKLKENEAMIKERFAEALGKEEAVLFWSHLKKEVVN